MITSNPLNYQGEEKINAIINFLKYLSLIGGLLLISST